MLQSERQKVAHLLRRFGLGVSEAELDYYGKDGLAGAIDKLLEYGRVDEGFDVEPASMANGKNGKLKPQEAQAWWILRMLKTRRPLQEKMTLFWHDHFATSADKVTAAPLMVQQNEIFRSNATGRFHDLLLAVSRDPAMLWWLDNQENVKGKPNENFAREVMELFTLGIGNYTEKDVQEAARAFTGWGLGRARRGRPVVGKGGSARFTVNPELHDEGIKTVLDNRGNFDGDDVIAILCGNPQTARFLTKKLWEWFAYPNPEPALVERLAQPFWKSTLDIKGLLRAIMTSPEFYSPKAYRAIYKNPVDFGVVTLRQLGYGNLVSGEPTGIRPVAAVRSGMKSMGMDLLFPPDVSGWDGGPAWVSSATMIERVKWADVVFGTGAIGVKRGTLRLNASAWPILDDEPTAAGVAQRLTSIFDADLPQAKTGLLADAVRRVAGERVTPENANQAAAAASRLIFGSPEFQFC